MFSSCIEKIYWNFIVCIVGKYRKKKKVFIEKPEERNKGLKTWKRFQYVLIVYSWTRRQADCLNIFRWTLLEQSLWSEKLIVMSKVMETSSCLILGLQSQESLTALSLFAHQESPTSATQTMRQIQQKSTVEPWPVSHSPNEGVKKTTKQNPKFCQSMMPYLH